MADITAILSATTSPDANTRQAAEAQLKQAQEQNLGAFLQSLANEVATEAKPLDSRRLAGLILKNALDAKDEAHVVGGRRHQANSEHACRGKWRDWFAGSMRGNRGDQRDPDWQAVGADVKGRRGSARRARRGQRSRLSCPESSTGPRGQS